MTRIMRDSRGVEWEYQPVGVGMRDDIPPGGTTLGEEFLLLACWQRGSLTIGFRHISAARTVDLDSPVMQQMLLG